VVAEFVKNGLCGTSSAMLTRMLTRSTYVVLAVVVMLALVPAFACSESMGEPCAIACLGRANRVESPRRLLARIALALRAALAPPTQAVTYAAVLPQRFAPAGPASGDAALSLRI